LAKELGGRASRWGQEALKLGLDLIFAEAESLEERYVVGESSI
jgi:hypothetical protein